MKWNERERVNDVGVTNVILKLEGFAWSKSSKTFTSTLEHCECSFATAFGLSQWELA